jgi:hypothetical protein
MRFAVFGVLLATAMAILAVASAPAAVKPTAVTASVGAAPSVLATVKNGTGGIRPESVASMLGVDAADPGVTLYTYLHAHGATMPSSWAQVVDSRHASACTEYARGYSDYPAGYVDEFGVDAALAHAAVAATGFCS